MSKKDEERILTEEDCFLRAKAMNATIDGKPLFCGPDRKPASLCLKNRCRGCPWTAKKEQALGVCFFELRPNALLVHGQPTGNDYDNVFDIYSRMEVRQGWWWGDLMVAMEKKIESDSKAIDELLKAHGVSESKIPKRKKLLGKAYRKMMENENVGRENSNRS